MITLIQHAQVFAPQSLGIRDVLVADSRIAAIKPEMDLAGDGIEVIDAEGRWLLPGFVDPLTHPCGGGGEGGGRGQRGERDAPQATRPRVPREQPALRVVSLGVGAAEDRDALGGGRSRSDQVVEVAGAQDSLTRPGSEQCELIAGQTADQDAAIPEEARCGQRLVVAEDQGGRGGAHLDLPDRGREGKARDGITLAEGARRALAADLIEIGVVEPNPAFLSNRCWTYLAVGCRAEGETHLDPSEEISVSLAPVGDFSRLIDDGAITHSLVIAAHDHLQRGIRRGADWTAKLP